MQGILDVFIPKNHSMDASVKKTSYFSGSYEMLSNAMALNRQNLLSI